MPAPIRPRASCCTTRHRLVLRAPVRSCRGDPTSGHAVRSLPVLFVGDSPRGHRERDRVHGPSTDQSPGGASYEAGRANARIHGNRSQASGRRRWKGSSRAGIAAGATDIVARIDVEQLEHVVNFDVPHLRRTTSTGGGGRHAPRPEMLHARVPEESRPGGDRTGDLEAAAGWSTASTMPPRAAVRGPDRGAIAEIRARKAEERRRERRRPSGAPQWGRGVVRPRQGCCSGQAIVRHGPRAAGPEAKPAGEAASAPWWRGGPKGGQGAVGPAARSSGPYR